LNSDTVNFISGHNIINFDIPFIIRRAFVNQYRYESLPKYLHVINRKPWELNHIIDTKRLFELTGYSGGIVTAGLDMLAYEYGFETSKNGEVDGSKIPEFLEGGGDIEKVYKYCEDDVWLNYNVLRVIY